MTRKSCYSFRLQLCYSSFEVGAGRGFAWMLEWKHVTHPIPLGEQSLQVLR